MKRTTKHTRKKKEINIYKIYIFYLVITLPSYMTATITTTLNSSQALVD